VSEAGLIACIPGAGRDSWAWKENPPVELLNKWEKIGYTGGFVSLQRVILTHLGSTIRIIT